MRHRPAPPSLHARPRPSTPSPPRPAPSCYAGGDEKDQEKLADVKEVMQYALGELRKEVAKERREDVAAKLAALVHADGAAGVEKDYEATDEFHDRWRLKSRDLLAQAEWRRRQLTQRKNDESKRLNRQLDEMHDKEVKAKEQGRKWEKGRDKRIGQWRDFMKTKGTKVVKKTGLPKQRANDEDRLYVRRAAGGDDAFAD